MTGYAELHCLSNYSFLRGASHPEELVSRAAGLGYSALAITDECTLAGVVRAHEAAQESGLKLLIGCEIRLREGPRLVLLAGDRRGYNGLCRLITQGRRSAAKGGYHLCRDNLADGLPGCLALFLPPADLSLDEAQLQWFAGLFDGRGWLAVELLRDGLDGERLALLQTAGRRHRLPLVAAGSVCMHVPDRRLLRDLLTAVRRRRPVAELGLAALVNGERHLRPLQALRHSIRRTCWRRAGESPRVAVFPWKSCATSTPTMSPRPAAHPAIICANWSGRESGGAGCKGVRTRSGRRSSTNWR